MESRLLRIGLVGCGEVAEHKHLRAMSQLAGTVVSAVADPDEARAKHVAGRYGIQQVFRSAESLLASGAADVIGILTNPGSHRELALQALAAGCHVLVEKPLALTLGDADAMIDFASSVEGQSRRTMTGFHMRWHRLIRRAHEFIRDGNLGEIESIHTVWNSPRPDAGIPLWKTERTTGGGALVELGVHLFDLWRFLLNDEVDEVFARARHGVRDDENVAVSARMSRGALATAQISERTAHSIQLDLCGSKGRLRVSAQRFEGFEFLSVRETDGGPGPRLRALQRFLQELPRGVARMRSLGDYGESYRGEWMHFLDCVREGRNPECSWTDGRRALEVVLAAAESERTGVPVRLNVAPAALAEVAGASPGAR